MGYSTRHKNNVIALAGREANTDPGFSVLRGNIFLNPVD